MFSYYYKLFLRVGNSKMTIVFQNFKIFRTFQHFTQIAKNGNLHN